MAKYVAIGKSSVHHIDFLVNGELVAPTSAKVTITNNAGSVIGTFNQLVLTLTSGQTGVDISVSGADNTNTLTNEVRYIEVDFVYEGITYTAEDYYFLRSSVKFPLKPVDVLTVLGMSAGDVPDEQIDILSAFSEVQIDVGDEVNLATILATGGLLLPALIEAVKLKAASYLSTGAQNSIMQMEQADNTLYRRFMEIDWKSIDQKISSMYARALAQLTSDTSGDTVITYSGMYSGTDPVTGE